MDKQEVIKLKALLPRTYIKIIKERTGKSEAAIFKTFDKNSELIVDDVVDAALDIIEEKKALDSRRKERMDNL